MTHVEHELYTLPEHLSLAPAFSGVWSMNYLPFPST